MDHLEAVPGRVILMVDTCHAAAILGSALFRNVRPVDAEELLRSDKGRQRRYKKSLHFFAAAASDQLAVESEKWKHGAMTHLVLQALRGDGGALKGKTVETAALGSYLREQLSKLTGRQQDAVSTTRPTDADPIVLFARP
jgi:hypothetical protein